MNSLSWMIYLAGMVDAIGFFLAFAFVALVISALVCFVIFGISHDRVFADEPKVGAKKVGLNCIWGLVAVSIVGAIIPSKSTVYAIAASEMGEKVINTPTAGKALKALDAWLDRQIAGEPAKSE